MTIAASFTRRPMKLDLRRERWDLPDGDFLDVDRMASPGADAPLVVVCHGLEGSSGSPYVLGILARARARGYAALALNFRGCSGEPNRAARLYHSGETTDLAFVIQRLLAEQPDRKLLLVGFSLGGNVVTKYLGEQGESAAPHVLAAAVVSVPFDLSACCDALDGPGRLARVYRQRFLLTLVPKALAKARAFPGTVDPDRIKGARLLREFDDAATAPFHGFAGAADYYARSSSGPFVAKVRTPLLVLSAEDDPFVPGSTLPTGVMKENPLVMPLISREGGHVGFLGGTPWDPTRWAEDRAMEFLAAHVPA
jgi:hypothetical protein